jgi:hypothetical protein
MKNTFKLQSAMEYLMTYGWAILIIAVVLGVLFQMGVFNSSSLTVRVPPGACKVLRTSAATNLVGQCSGILPQYVAQFDGQSSYVNAGNGASLQIIGAGSVSAWVQPSSVASFPAIASKSNWNAGSNGFTLGMCGNKACFDTDNAIAQDQLRSNGLLTTGMWYYVTATWDSSHLNIYINGVLDNSAVETIIPTYTNYNLEIGRDAGGSDYFYNGKIADVMVYNISLDASSIATLYQEGIGGAPVNPQYLVGWWPLNGDTKDYSGNNNNGAPTAITYVSQYGK